MICFFLPGLWLALSMDPTLDAAFHSSFRLSIWKQIKLLYNIRKSRMLFEYTTPEHKPNSNSVLLRLFWQKLSMKVGEFTLSNVP